MFFSIPNNQSYPYSLYDSSSSSSDDMYSSYSTSPTVDCTLSLGTPSTRSYSYDHHQKQQTTNQQYHPLHDNHSNNTNNNGSTNFCWDFIHPAKQHQFPPSNNNSHVKSSSNRGGGGGNHINHHTNTNSDCLLARRCANCDTTSTPLWRNGPRGPKSLCNACGIRFKKEERRASAASTNYNGGGGVIMESSSQEMSAGGHYYNSNNHSSSQTIHHSSSHQKMPASCFSPAMANEFRFIEDNDHHQHHHLSESNGISFLSWRLNVSDRPGLVHDFTRQKHKVRRMKSEKKV